MNAIKRALCATTYEDNAKAIVESLNKLAEYKNTIGKDVGKYYRKWNVAHPMPKVNPKELEDKKLFEAYGERCKTYFKKRNSAVAEYEKLKKSETDMPEIAKKVLPLVDNINPDWSSTSFAYSSIPVVRV